MEDMSPMFLALVFRTRQKAYQPPVINKTILTGDQDLISVIYGNKGQANKKVLEGGCEGAEENMEREQ